MCEHDGVEVYVASRRQFSVSSFHHKVLEAKAVSTLTASVLPIVPLRHFNIPQPCTLGVWFWDGVWFFFFFWTSLEFTQPWILTLLPQIPQYQRLWASFIRPMFTVLYFYSLRIVCVCVGGVSSAKVHIWRSFCSCYSISFVEDCRCLVHHYSNSTIIKSEEGLRLLSTRMTGIHRYTRLLFLYHTFRIQPIQLSTEVESCV